MYNKSTCSSGSSEKNANKVRLRRKCQQHNTETVATEAAAVTTVTGNVPCSSTTTPTIPPQIADDVNMSPRAAGNMPHDAAAQQQLTTFAVSTASAAVAASPKPFAMSAFATGTALSPSPSPIACATVSASNTAMQLILQSASASAPAPVSAIAIASTSRNASVERTLHVASTRSAPYGTTEDAHDAADAGVFPKCGPVGTAPSSSPVRVHSLTAVAGATAMETPTATATATVSATLTVVRSMRAMPALRGMSTATDQLTKVKKITMESTTTKKASAMGNEAASVASVRDRRSLIQKQAKPSATGRRAQSATTSMYAPASAIAASALATATETETDTAMTATTTAVVVAVAAAATKLNCEKVEIKCPLETLTNVSNQRKVEANATLPQQRKALEINSNSNRNTNRNNYNKNNNSSSSSKFDRGKSTTSNKWAPVQCETTAECEHPIGLTATSAQAENAQEAKRTLSLATRKAKLKAEFFKDFERNARKSARAQSVAVIEQQSSRSASCEHPTAKPVTVLSAISVNISAPEDLASTSIVAQRKLDLKRKLEQKSSPKSSPPISPSSNFPRVESLVHKFDTNTPRKMIVNPNKLGESNDSSGNMLTTLKVDALEQRSSPLSDEGCTLGQSPYSSDNEDNESIRTTSTTIERSKRKEKVARSASSDSALGLDVDESMDTAPAQPPVAPQQRRMTLTVTDLPLRPALLPLAEPTALPDSPTIDVQQNVSSVPVQATVPSKVLLEERVVELPEDPRTLGCSLASSRRESAQSCGSDYMPSELPPGGRRFVRTPSVVVSDYSDEVMCGITLEEIEYFRAQRMQRRHSSLDTANEGDGESDVSASSSCSNLYYCGSTISALDGSECYVNGVRTSLDRKTSDCSTCSVSADEDSFTIPEDPQQVGKDLADLLAAQHLSTKQTKKVGLVVPMCDNLSNKAEY